MLLVNISDLEKMFQAQQLELRQIIEESKSESRYLTRKQVAQYLNIALSTVDLWSKLGKLRKIYMDGSVRFDREEIDKNLKNSQT